ncbi:SNF2 family N-terminal domain-containing protein [Dipodascopsis uninucleata]
MSEDRLLKRRRITDKRNTLDTINLLSSPDACEELSTGELKERTPTKESISRYDSSESPKIEVPRSSPNSERTPENGRDSYRRDSQSNPRPVSGDTFYASLINGRKPSFDSSRGINNQDAYGIDTLPRSNLVPSKVGSSNPFPLLFNRSAPASSSSIYQRNGTASPNYSNLGNSSLSPQSRMRSLVGRFASSTDQKIPISSNSDARLSGNGGSANNTLRPVSKGHAVKKMVQRGPAPARPVDTEISLKDLPRDQIKIIERLQEVFPTYKLSTLLSAVNLKSNFDDAAEWLSLRDEALIGSDKHISNSPTSPTKLVTSKRDITKPAKSIREKFSATQSANVINLSSSQASESDNSKLKITNPANHISIDDVDEIVDVDGDSDSNVESEEIVDNTAIETQLLRIFNNDSAEVIMDVAFCANELADNIIAGRPYSSLDEVRIIDNPSMASADTDASKKKAKRQRRPAGDRAVDTAIDTLSGYEAVDSLIRKCESLGRSVSDSIKKWGVTLQGANGELELIDLADDDGGNSSSKSVVATTAGGGYFTEQPSLLPEDIKLKSYQQVGINWLSLMYKKKLSCILADEMGLGKTCQVISFLAHLKEIGINGPHLVVVPSSTLENWLREFKRFCPSLVVEPYYGSQKERQEIRAVLLEQETDFDVLVTTYNLATGSPLDCSFLRSFKFNVCVYDEGHMLKNSNSERYQKLMKLKAEFRLLLTGTPLQNNLQELISLLAFILPYLFKERKNDLEGVFKHKAKTMATDKDNSALLSQQRILRAKTMMTPFVLRRRKDMVLKHLPRKTHSVEYCDLCAEQKELYDNEIERSRRTIEAREAGKPLPSSERSSVNILMQLRKAAVHPLLFRRLYTTEILRKMAKDIMKEERYYNADEQYIFEDMEVMSDFELHNLCMKFTSINKYMLQQDEWMQSGKVQKIKSLLIDMKKSNDRVLIFSQFTQVLDILENVLSTIDMTFLRMDGQTSVEVRQDLIDKFYEEEDINCFLLSTKAGGFGINLACANVVIIFDMSFNPHDDRQAEDRAHRVGQTKEVRVIRLVSKGTIEEAILQLANTKLALDKSVSDESEQSKTENANAELVENMLFKHSS